MWASVVASYNRARDVHRPFGETTEIMAKQIEIDDAAYGRLEQARQPDENWSGVIKRCVPMKRTLRDVLRVLRRAAPSAKTLDLLEASVAARRRRPRTQRS